MTVPEYIHELPADFDWSPQAVFDYVNDNWEQARDTDAVGTLFSLAAGLYWYCVEWHGGQWSEEYRISCQLGYSPGAGECSPVGDDGECIDDEREDDAYVYQQLQHHNQES